MPKKFWKITDQKQIKEFPFKEKKILSLEPTPYSGAFTVNLAGIIPVSNFRSDMGLPYHDCLLPVAPGLTAIENAVYTCLLASCKTIWIVCEDDTMPIVKDIIGEYIKYGGRTVPIFYTPCNPKDIGRRNSYAFSIIQGAKTAIMATNSYSSWLSPNKFFVVFPMSIVSHEDIIKHKDSHKFRAPFHNNLFFDKNEESFINNKMFPFGITVQHLNQCSFHVARTATNRSILREGAGAGPLSMEGVRENYEKVGRIYDARFFTLSEVFSPVATSRSHMETISMFDISSWEGYKDYLNSGGEKLISPKAKIIKSSVEEIRTWNYQEEETDYATEYEKLI